MDNNIKPKNIFNYIVFPGNNHTLIKKALQKRKNWTQLTQQDLYAANFIWKPLNLSSRTYHQIDQRLKFLPNYQVLINHFQSNSLITTKSGLTKSLKYFYSHQQAIFNQNYHVFESIPTTFIVQAHKQNIEYKNFIERFGQISRKCFTKEKVPEKHCENNIWIIKPEAQNQGRGIELFRNMKDIQTFLLSKPLNTNWIIQKCIQKPLLYYGRKFDVRMWVLVSPQFQIYYYKKAYMRTSSYEYDSVNLENVVQLTNNCYQKKTEQYSKHEQGNTLPIQCLQVYLNEHQKYKDYKINVQKSIISRMKDLILDSILCAKKNLYKQKRQKEFQLFGYDFLIDEDLRTWLLQVNNNPYLGVPNNYIKDLLPLMVDQMFEIVLDPLFPPSQEYKKVDQKNFIMIYNQQNFLSRKIRNQRSSTTKNYYPISLNNIKTRSITKVLRTQDPFQINGVTSERQTKGRQKYATPAQSIKMLLQNYFFSDFYPFQIPVSILLTSNRLQDPLQLETNLKSLKMITDTRLCQILLESKFIQMCENIFIKQYPQKIKSILICGYSNATKTAKDRKKVIQKILPIISQNLIHKMNKKQYIDQQLLINTIKLTIICGGVFQRKVVIPGETRQNQYVREYFIRQNGIFFLLYILKNKPQICKNQILSFFNNLEEKDWQILQKLQKIGSQQMINWQKKYKCNPILKQKNIKKELKQTRTTEPNFSIYETLKAQIKMDQLQSVCKNNIYIKSRDSIKGRKSIYLFNETQNIIKPQFPTLKKVK